MRLRRPACGTLLHTVALLALAAGQSAAQAQVAPDTAALEALYWARIEQSRAGFTAADVTYMKGMIGHHAQALVMSAMAPTHGAGPELLRLAARIDNAQRDEIASMQKWLRDRGQPVPDVPELESHAMAGMDHGTMDHGGVDHGGVDHGTMDHGGTAETDRSGTASIDHASMDHGASAGMDHAGMDHSMMPGMLTPAQLAELDAARGTEFDRLFLRFMIQHHGGAVSMVETLFATDGAALDGEAFKLATDVQVDQRTEIARMQRMLDRLEAPPAPRR